jgi:hypothetical protein
MKVAVVKQVLDICGPWQSVRWRDTTPEHIFNYWPGKGQFWEMTCLLKADWFVIPQQQTTDYTRWAVLNHRGHEALIYKYTSGVVEPGEIPFSDYDLVITVDAILDVPSGAKPLFVYYASEHKDRHYLESRVKPLRNYDLFLDHMMEASGNLKSIPQPIAFPYLRDPDTVRALFAREREEAIGIDWRTIATLTLADFDDTWNDACDAAARRLEEVVGLPLRFTGELFRGVYGVNDPPLWGHSRRYLEMISKCKYYLAAGRISGAGQGLADAASLGCICIGQKDKVYHRMICHPDCLSESLIEMPEIVRRIVNSAGLHKEILAWQNQRLLEQFVRGPITILEEAIRWKQERAAGSSPMAGDLAHGVLAGRNALRGTPRSTAKAGQ